MRGSEDDRDGSSTTTFACKAFRARCETLEATGIGADEPLGDVREAGFVDLLPALGLKLPECPGCSGPTEVQDALIAARS